MKKTRKYKILALHNNTGSRFYRLIPQLKEMQAQGHEVMLEPHNAENIYEKIDWADLIIFEMILSDELVKYAKSKGKKLVYECDDLIHRVPKGHYEYERLKGFGGIKVYFQLRKMLKKCDGFISTCKELDKKYGKFCKKHIVFKNYCDLPHWLKEHKENKTDRIRILWAGSTSHSPDLEMIKPVMDRIMKEYPQVQFIYIGHGGIKTTDKQAEFVYGKDIFDGLPDNRESMLPVPPNVWPYILASEMADIGIAPLVKHEFNRAKSQCKYLEYGINKIPAVYSEWFYKDVKHGQTGFLAKDNNEFYHYLKLLIEEKEFRRDMGEHAYEDVIKNHDMRNYVGQWVSFIDKIIK